MTEQDRQEATRLNLVSLDGEAMGTEEIEQLSIEELEALEEQGRIRQLKDVR
jgi:hypothetical protein